ncbi:penicillin acylase family protein [Polymorphobacter sp. PAMC 29334]|uniref:penicillin acylase family protein n=1 Tax=Polymorphobacter sp. PAMC 29334 TaxID=2862331 RepID=UPI001C76F10B|nr:penicillin acylase family protein [Polymorphobacter sp. PAMC 29334]QYE35785.1 penicillin acylase family protein [Polymorphobacter sp. PAMC 29334]
MDKALRRTRNLLIMLAAGMTAVPGAAETDTARWQREAARVTIVRDDWGIPHVSGPTDADAVFGLMYAQAEDDFARIEANYLTALGRTAEVDGEDAIWGDLRQRLFVDPAELKAEYAKSPAWLRTLMEAWADGLNFYLASHPGTKPRVLTRFEPWMALSFTEGSIGGDIERISLSSLKTFYGQPTPPTPEELGMVLREPSGSNGIAIAPRLTANGHALLLINPHTSFYFRSEAQMTSAAGLNAYGASTWGQFFVYQGFNASAGWMHTSSTADAVDEFAEKVTRTANGWSYRYGKAARPVASRVVTLRFRRPDGTISERSFTTYRTRHGPVVSMKAGKWIATALMWKPVPALEQSYLRTKATNLASYMTSAALQANSSNDTLFADSTGEIAFLMPQYIPLRNDRFDYTRPVDGSDPATDWRGLHTLASLPSVVNPRVGWAHNTNDWPWSAAGPDSPKAADYPRYMDQAGGNARGVHADLLLTGKSGWTPETLRAAAFDPYLPAFARLLPALVEAWSALPASDARKPALAAPIALLKGWDYRWSADSTATSLAVFWGDQLWRDVGSFAQAERLNVPDYIATRVSPDAKLAALTAAVGQLTRDFGSWQTPWQTINRFQRLDDAIAPHFDDAKASLPVPFTSAQWGSLASFGAKSWPGTTRYYGTSGNSFVAVVEFGSRVKAMAVMAGGQSGDPTSPHFADQIARYAAGALRPVYFYPDELSGHVERRYHPGG